MMTGKTTTNIWTLALVAAAVLGLAIAPAHADLIGHWKFDEGAGPTTADSSVNGNTATQAGTVGSWIVGKAGSAYQLGSGTSRFELADSSDLQVTGALTVSAWVNPFATSSYGLVAGVDQTGGTPNDMYALKTNSGDRPFWAVLGRFGPLWAVIGPGTDVGLTASDTLATLGALGDGWVHLVGVYDPVSGFAGLYVNGVLDVSTASVPTSIQSKTTPFQIGHNASDSGGNPLKAAVDDVQIYDQALAPADVASLYANPGFPFPLGPSVSLSATTIASNAPPGTLVGTLDFSPDGPSETFTFAAGAGDTDNGKFDILNTNELRSNEYLPNGSYDIRIAGDDGAATTAENTFTITASAATYSAFVASAGVTAGVPVGGEVVATLEARLPFTM